MSALRGWAIYRLIRPARSSPGPVSRTEFDCTPASGPAQQPAGRPSAGTPAATSGPLVTVGIPIRNAESYLEQALASIQGQTYRNLEILIADNNSQDRSPAICRTAAESDPRIRYFRHTEDRGMVENFNFLVHSASGEFFMWHAHDDLRSPDYVERAVGRMLSDSRVVLCHSGVVFRGAEGEPTDWVYDASEIRAMDERSVYLKLRSAMTSASQFAFYGLMRLSALRATRGCLKVRGFDHILVLEVLLHGDVAFLPEPLFTYRVIPKSDDAALYAGMGESEAAQGHAARYDMGTSFLVEVARGILRAPAAAGRRPGLLGFYLLGVACHWVGPAGKARRDCWTMVRTYVGDRDWKALGLSFVLLPAIASPTGGLLRLAARLRRRFRPRSIPQRCEEPAGSIENAGE